MKKIYNDLWQTTQEHPFAGLNAHAYFLKRSKGNVLFYNTSNPNDIEQISDLGGITFQYLSHRHESGQSLATIKSRFNSRLCADELEAPFIESTVDVEFSTRALHSSTIEIVPTPGHTGGGLCFYCSSDDGRRYLFTGDTLFQSHGQWGALVIANDGGSTEKLVASLLTIRSLEPDVVICSASVGDVSVAEVTRQAWLKAIDSVISSLTEQT